MSTIKIKGLVIGKRVNNREKNFSVADIVHIQKEYRPRGPAENSMIEIIHTKKGATASYIPWVGYFDLDQQVKREPTSWKIIDPGQNYSLENVTWVPFLDD